MDDETAEKALADDLPNVESRAAQLIRDARQGDAASINDLISFIYPELKRRARWLMNGEKIGRAHV